MTNKEPLDDIKEWFRAPNEHSKSYIYKKKCEHPGGKNEKRPKDKEQ